MHQLQQQSRAFEAFNQRCLRAVLVEERRRYCALVDNYCAVFGVDFDRAAPTDNVTGRVLQAAQRPDELSPGGEQLVRGLP